MRRLVIIASVVVVVAILILVAAATLFNVDKYRPRIQAELQSKLGRPVTLGELHLRLLPLSIRVDGLTIGESPAFPSQRPFATAKEVYASASAMSLLRGQPTIRDLTLDTPQIELIRNPGGVWNFSDLGGGAKPAPGAETETGNKPSGGGGGLTLDQLKIKDGQLGVTDERTKSPRTVYNHIDLTLTGFAPGKQFDFDLAAHFPGQGKELLAFNGKAGPLEAGKTQAVPVNGHISIQQISLAGLNSVAAGAIPPNTDASATGDATITSNNGNTGCKGNLRLDNPVVRGAKVAYPIETQYDLSMSDKNEQIQVQSGVIKIGPTVVNLSGNIDSGTTPSTLNMRLTTTNASLTELSRLASAFGAASNPNDQIKGSLSADLTAKGPMTAPQVQGTLGASTLQAQELVLTNVHATCNMNNGVVQLSPVTATVYGGQENGTITLDTKAAHPLCSVKTKLSGVDTNALLSAVSSVKNTLYGSLAADADLSFALDTSNNLAQTLNGGLAFGVTNGKLKNINIMSELSKIGKFLNSAPAQSGTDTTLQKLAGTFDIKNGLATTNNLTAAMDTGSLSAKGSLNLVNEGINMHMNAVLASGVSKTVGGNSVGGFLNTALANKNGELVIPVIVTGTMAHPVFAPDVQQLAQMKLQHLLPTTGDPSKMTSGALGSVLGGLTGKQSGQQQQQQQQQNPLNSIFKKLPK